MVIIYVKGFIGSSVQCSMLFILRLLTFVSSKASRGGGKRVTAFNLLFTPKLLLFSYNYFFHLKVLCNKQQN